MLTDPRVHGFLTGPHPRAFVHRGWHRDDLAGMENSLSAFRRAVSEGYHYLETDVHATADGVPVVHHDPRLERTTDARGPIAAQTWDQVRKANIGGREPLPTLAELLAAVPGAKLNIDIKADRAVEPVLEVLAEADAWDRVCLASFSEARMARVRALAGPRALTSMGLRAMLGFWTAAKLPAGFSRRPRPRPVLAQVPVRQGPLTVVTTRLVEAARRRRGEVHVWTIDDAPTMHALLDLGVDGLMTDNPAVLREVFIERGLWA
ncbi:glycerophosphodiester phosphodiesterase [Actinokineospora bangkokensis]|uniref:Glycerophosphodiester phosphodiesterase n=1 Tax=Actinokineospora bangkokensis TaxID=1193682 RepID=A0A1Q9LP15_9PSEU|nr:glycerophosphodiester phosphodiesterase [Actinokineospora bangkokensis]OLR93758.1 glycerophosphodiester phosphodiesterase [Actinokineospora bangkokensis]